MGFLNFIFPIIQCWVIKTQLFLYVDFESFYTAKLIA